MKSNAKFYGSVIFWLEVVATIFVATQLGAGRFNFAWWGFFIFFVLGIGGIFNSIFPIFGRHQQK